MITLKDNGDGTLLGADEAGRLFDGKVTTATFDLVERVVLERSKGRVLYQDVVAGVVVAAGDIEEECYTEGQHQKAYREDGSEKTFTVVNWTEREAL